jgi:hypothetical protein
MDIPAISIRRSPRITFTILPIGLVVVIVGLVYSDMFVIFAGVLPVLLAGMMMLNPMVVLSDDHVELKNIFGLTRASYEHDGLHLVQVQADVIFIQKGDLRAPLRRVIKSRLHKGDWEVMLKVIAEAHAHHKAKGKSKATH